MNGESSTGGNLVPEGTAAVGMREVPAVRNLTTREWQLQHARREVEVCEIERANLTPEQDLVEPRFPLWMWPVFVFSVGATMTMAFYDQVFAQMLDQNAALVAGAVGGVVVCLPVVSGMVDSIRRPNTWLTQVWWISVSVALSGMLLAIRLAQAGDDASQTLLAVGMAGLELIILLALKLICSGVGRELKDYRRRRNALVSSGERLAAARRRYAWLVRDLQGLKPPPWPDAFSELEEGDTMDAEAGHRVGGDPRGRARAR